MKCFLINLQVELWYLKRTIHSWISKCLNLTYIWRQALSILLQHRTHGEVGADMQTQMMNPKAHRSTTHVWTTQRQHGYFFRVSQAFSEEVTPPPALASKLKERAPSLTTCPRGWNFKNLPQILFLLLYLDPRYRKKDQYYHLGTMKRLNQSRVHPGMNNDLKNQRCEDFDRLVTFQLILQVISVWRVCSSQELSVRILYWDKLQL